jgi:hypothetical protein
MYICGEPAGRKANFFQGQGVAEKCAKKSVFTGSMALKGIVSQDFEVFILVLLDSSDIATPSGAGSFFFKVEFSIFRALVLVVFAGHESRLRARPGLIS